MATSSSDLSRLFLRQIADRRLALPMLPGVAAEVLALTQQEHADAAMLSRVIHRDQTLATNVLRVANSVAHVGQVPCASLQNAVSRLGMQLITEIALAVSVRGRLFGNSRMFERLQALWRHSVVTGFFTKEIARQRRRNVEIAFLCGLLHDVGKAVLLDNLDRLLGPDPDPVPLPQLAAALHEHHAAAGALLAQEWRLPDQLAEAVVHHHAYESAPRFSDMAMMTCLGDLLAHAVLPDDLDGPSPALEGHPVLAGLNLYPDQLQALLDQGEQAIAVAEGLR